MAGLDGIPGITLIQLDVTSIESIRHAKGQVASVLGDGIGLDMLVNNAGVTTTLAALDQDLSETKQMFETNVFGVMAMVQEFMPLLMLSQDASIVNIGSFVALIPFPFGSSYSATKAALHSYSDALRLGMLLLISSNCLSY
jgi:1-acylglycerone phosphate reductase